MPHTTNVVLRSSFSKLTKVTPNRQPFHLATCVGSNFSLKVTVNLVNLMTPREP